MVGTRLIATPDARYAAEVHGQDDTIGVALFHRGSSTLPGLGANLHMAVRRGLPSPPSIMAWDFLSIALAAFAADRFVLRNNSEDGWTRVIALDIALQRPQLWRPQAKRLASTLRFLTGDIWYLSFRAGGSVSPEFDSRLTDRNAVCLFSGGLDSLLGALKLLEDGQRPLLVSQGSPKEITPQKYLCNKIKMEPHRFEGRVNEKWRPPYEGSTRGRSLIFFAYGVLAASALRINEVIVPENGLIAVNPPLTRRRLGSLSTRTTHPYFLSELSSVLQAVGIDVRLRNIFEGATKGQMLAESRYPQIETLASASYSCGKGKRKNGQCGRCIPCLIRRAAFHKAGIRDRTKPYFFNIRSSKTQDDILSARIAIEKIFQMSMQEFERWVATSGPLPADQVRRSIIMQAVRDGLMEVSSFLRSIRWR